MDHNNSYNYGGNPYPYPYPYPYPPLPDPSPPPPSYLYPPPPPSPSHHSNSFPSAPHLNHSGPLSYPPSPSPYPYPYPHSHPFDPNPYPNPSPNPNLYPTVSAPSPPSSPPKPLSSYPINDLLANMSLSQPPPPPLPRVATSVPHHPYPHHSHSGSFSNPSSPFAPVGPGAIVPFGGSPSAAHMQLMPFGSHKGNASLKVLLLHGSLDIVIMDAKNLPNMDMFSKRLGDVLGPRVASTLGGKVEHMSKMTSDPYVTVNICDAVIARTYVVSNSEDPVWSQHFNVPVAHHTAEVRFVVKDSDVVGAQLIGTVSIPAEWIYSGERVEGTYPILGPNGKQCKVGAVLRFAIQYIPIEKLSIYHHGVGTGPNYIGVPGTYFPLRRGCRVTLYQDAHVPDGCLPDLRLERDMYYEHGKCWRDIYFALSQARRLIYITGWSVFHTIHLIREPGFESTPTLGDLLRMKSQEGVRVLLLVWDDPTSRSILGIKTSGVMGTRDEETRRFFKNSSVQVLLCPRSAGKRHSFLKQQETGTIYTHHQKQIVVDADAGYGRRKIMAFVGGLDLCGGRYDTPQHSLFRTLQSVHKPDYYNPNFVESDSTGPREPWHDLHTRIDGPAAYDVLKNFEERWLKASKRHGIKKLKKSFDDALLLLDKIPEIMQIDDPFYLTDNDPESWHVQIFRSIDSNSAKGFPKDPREATSKNLVCGKNVLIDMSIHTAYIHAIRSAQHFIYVENQYFLGSSFNWDSNKDLGANNLVPMEIALKIANKIKANERFSAYIVIPMWPEGNPTGAPTQRILYWQKKTMQMMYETIYTALKEAGLDDIYEPQDYLNFFCLGNRENTEVDSGNRNGANTPQALAKKNRRFMIYVHSKGMIVDDEFVIVGSANINQRSMEGTRDTEIAMGAYQPQYTWANKLSAPRGQIYGYRMSLWAEHTGMLEDCFTYPESLECMRRVRDLGQHNWDQYVADEVTEMRGHLLKYPVDVDRKGKVKPLPGCQTFPDIGGNICGSFIAIQENLTI